MATVARVFRYDITIHQGVDEYFPMRIQDRHGSVPDLTDWTSIFRLYRAPATLESLHDASPVPTPGAIVMLGLMDGGEFGDYNVLLSFPSHTTSELIPWGRGVHNVDVIDPYGHVQYRVRGTVELEEGTKHG